MTVLSIPWTFTAGDNIVASQVNANFTAVKDYVNSNVVLKDAPTFTSIPTLPATDPSSDNQATRKKYVDTTVSASGLNRLKVNGVGGLQTGATVAVGSSPTVSTTQFVVEAGVASFTAADGIFSVTFPVAFTNGVISIVATVTGSSTYEAGTPNAWVRIGAQSKTAFSGIVLQPGSVFGVTGAVAFPSACKVNWIAVGW